MRNANFHLPGHQQKLVARKQYDLIESHSVLISRKAVEDFHRPAYTYPDVAKQIALINQRIANGKKSTKRKRSTEPRSKQALS